MGCFCSHSKVEPNSLIINTLEGHTGGITCISSCFNLSLIATGSQDTTIRLWSYESHRTLGVLHGHKESVSCMTTYRSLLFSGSNDKTIRKWDLSTKTCIMILHGHLSRVNRLLLVDDLLFSSSYDKTVRCWHRDSGNNYKIFDGHKRGVYAILFLMVNVNYWPDEKLKLDPLGSRLLITGSADMTSKLWMLDNGNCVQTFKGHFGAVTCLSVYQLHLFTGSTDCTIRSWSIKNGTAMNIFKGHQGPVLCLQINSDTIFSGSTDHTVRSWSIPKGLCIKVYRDFGHAVSRTEIIDGILYSTCGDGIFRCHDVQSTQLIHRFIGHKSNIIDFQKIEDQLFTISLDCTMKVWNLAVASSFKLPLKLPHSKTDFIKY